MNYRQDKYGNSISVLGFGCMRFPQNLGKIDMEETEREIMLAYDAGVNYYDTAWGYHSGNSEIVMGKVLKNYPRDSFYLASKFPGYDLSPSDSSSPCFFFKITSYILMLIRNPLKLFFREAVR